MKLLLDTHIWLWSLQAPEKLSVRVRRELESSVELWLSAVSIWEALLLYSKGRIRLQEDVMDWLGAATAETREAPLTHEIVLAAHQLRFEHQDPADRFLVATAQVLKLTLVTADQHLLGLGTVATLANR